MRSRRWSWVAKLTLSAALIGYILWWVPWPEIRSSLLSANPLLVALALVLSVPVIWTVALQMKLLFDATDDRLSTAAILEVNLTTEFYAFFLPGYALAGALRWYRLTKRGTGSMTTLAVMVYNRLISITSVALTGVVFLLLDPPDESRVLIASLLISTFVVLLLLHTLAFQPALAAKIGRYAGRKAGTTMLGRVAARTADLSKTVEVLGSLTPRNRFAVYGVCMARQVLSIVVFCAFAASLSLEITWINVGLTRAAAILITLIPISFAGVGVREGGLIFTLTRFGVPPGPAVAMSFLVLGRDLLMRLTGGFLEARSSLFGQSRP